MTSPIKTIVFDLGNVLIEWNPPRLYKPYFVGREAEFDFFFDKVCSHDWNLTLDKGGSFDEAIAQKQREFPHYAEPIGWWKSRWLEMIGPQIEGTREILFSLRDRGADLVALTNWSAETFPLAQARFDGLSVFRDIVVSGTEKLIKPDPAIYRLAESRYGRAPHELLFIDDSHKNVEAARACGWQAIQFSSPEALRVELQQRGFL